MNDTNLTTEQAHVINNKITELEKKVSSLKQQVNPENVFFDNKEFIRLMKISNRTAIQWRANAIIAYSQVNNKIYYRLSDILELLHRNYKPASKK